MPSKLTYIAGEPTRGQHTCERCHRIIGPTLTSTELDNAMKLNNATVEPPNDAIKVPHLKFEGKFRVVCDGSCRGDRAAATVRARYKMNARQNGCAVNAACYLMALR